MVLYYVLGIQRQLGWFSTSRKLQVCENVKKIPLPWWYSGQAWMGVQFGRELHMCIYG